MKRVGEIATQDSTPGRELMKSFAYQTAAAIVFSAVQFWYTEETAGILAKEVVEAAGPSGRIACIACPSLFRALRTKHPDANAHLFEVDLRFEVSTGRSNNH